MNFIVRGLGYLPISTNNNDVVMDFFAGTAMTAYATMSLNAEDGFNRKWICVQLPEPTDKKGLAYSKGYMTISDIAKELVRKVSKNIEDKVSERRGYYNGLREVYGYKEGEIKELQSEEEGYIYDFNDGFKVFKLGKSNYTENQFEFIPEKSDEENRKAFNDYLKKSKQSSLFDKAKDIDIVYENIIKEGLSLNSKISSASIGKNKIYKVADNEREIFLCLDKAIDNSTVKEIINQYKKKTFICLDNALDDTAKANLGLQVELKTI